MQIAVHDDQTTERVGTLDIDEVSGAVAGGAAGALGPPWAVPL